jgi:hypothetical protein
MHDPFWIIVSGSIAIVGGITWMFREAERRSVATRKYAEADPGLRAAIIDKVIRIGMTEEQAIDAWGRPQTRTVQVLKTKTKVTLRYGRSYVYIVNGRVEGWRTPT